MCIFVGKQNQKPELKQNQKPRNHFERCLSPGWRLQRFLGVNNKQRMIVGAMNAEGWTLTFGERPIFFVVVGVF